jgi:hypothetical protein
MVFGEDDAAPWAFIRIVGLLKLTVRTQHWKSMPQMIQKSILTPRMACEESVPCQKDDRFDCCPKRGEADTVRAKQL